MIVSVNVDNISTQSFIGTIVVFRCCRVSPLGVIIGDRDVLMTNDESSKFVETRSLSE